MNVMNLFLTLAFLFSIGSTAGWVLELFYRHFASGKRGQRKWMNPGFDSMGHGAIVCLGSSVTCAWKEEEYKGMDFVQAAAAAAEKYRKKLDRYISDRTVRVKQLNNRYSLKTVFDQCAPFYKKKTTKKKK